MYDRHFSVVTFRCSLLRLFVQKRGPDSCGAERSAELWPLDKLPPLHAHASDAPWVAEVAFYHYVESQRSQARGGGDGGWWWGCCAHLFDSPRLINALASRASWLPVCPSFQVCGTNTRRCWGIRQCRCFSWQGAPWSAGWANGSNMRGEWERQSAGARACTASQCLDSSVGVRHKWKKRFPLQRIRECGRRACVIVKVFWQRLPLLLFAERWAVYNSAAARCLSKSWKYIYFFLSQGTARLMNFPSRSCSLVRDFISPWAELRKLHFHFSLSSERKSAL